MTGLTLLTAALSMHIGGYFTYVSTPKSDLDRCEAQLSKMYDACKAKGYLASDCNRAATTTLCGFTWSESYGAYLDRRIEESAAPGMPFVFTGLSKIKPAYVTAGGR